MWAREHDPKLLDICWITGIRDTNTETLTLWTTIRNTTSSVCIRNYFVQVCCSRSTERWLATVISLLIYHVHNCVTFHNENRIIKLSSRPVIGSSKHLPIIIKVKPVNILANAYEKKEKKKKKKSQNCLFEYSVNTTYQQSLIDKSVIFEKSAS